MFVARVSHTCDFATDSPADRKDGSSNNGDDGFRRITKRMRRGNQENVFVRPPRDSVLADQHNLHGFV